MRGVSPAGGRRPRSTVSPTRISTVAATGRAWRRRHVPSTYRTRGVAGMISEMRLLGSLAPAMLALACCAGYGNGRGVECSADGEALGVSLKGGAVHFEGRACVEWLGRLDMDPQEAKATLNGIRRRVQAARGTGKGPASVLSVSAAPGTPFKYLLWVIGATEEVVSGYRISTAGTLMTPVTYIAGTLERFAVAGRTRAIHVLVYRRGGAGGLGATEFEVKSESIPLEVPGDGGVVEEPNPDELARARLGRVAMRGVGAAVRAALTSSAETHVGLVQVAPIFTDVVPCEDAIAAMSILRDAGLEIEFLGPFWLP